jgi:pimeloyl-ACP methyl ester carboxylesterase
MATRDIQVGDGTLRTRIVGEGPAVVFVHGALVDGRLWEGVTERLAGRFQCVVRDLPLGSHAVPLPPEADRSVAGHARRIARLLEVLDLRDVTLVGNDTGGAICQLVAVNHPERLGRLVLTNSDPLEVFSAAGLRLPAAPRPKQVAPGAVRVAPPCAPVLAGIRAVMGGCGERP